MSDFTEELLTIIRDGTDSDGFLHNPFDVVRRIESVIGRCKSAPSPLALRLADCRQALHDAKTTADLAFEVRRAFELMGEAMDALAGGSHG